MKLKSLIAAAAVLMLVPAMAVAQKAPSDRISADRAIHIAENRYSGAITRRPELEYDKGRWRYDVHLKQKNGQIRVVSVDAKTGKIFNQWISTPARERQKERNELWAAHKDLVNSGAYRTFISHPGADRARRLLESHAYQDYRHAFAIVDQDRWQYKIPTKERNFYHNLQAKINRYRGH